MAQVGRLIDPIFVFGMMQRSGTGMVSDLLRLHPQCQRVLPAEDHLLRHIHFLENYVEALYGSWNRSWGVRSLDSKALLRRCLGRGLLQFLSFPTVEQARAFLGSDPEESPGQSTSRMVTRTPSVEHLDSLFDYFPGAQAVIVVRDGRAVVESGVRTFGWSYEEGIRQWRSAVRVVEGFRRRYADRQDQFLVVRYEDLHQQPETELRQILQFLHLDASCYDFEQATKMPVRGSSEFGQASDEEAAWQPVEKSEEFQPLQRWRDWTPARHQRFNWLAGSELQSLGYPLHEPARSNLASAATNAVQDALWYARQLLLAALWKLRRPPRREA